MVTGCEQLATECSDPARCFYEHEAVGPRARVPNEAPFRICGARGLHAFTEKQTPAVDLNEVHHALLSRCISLDVTLSGAECLMAGKNLHVA
jgi:hypothetical protein